MKRYCDNSIANPTRNGDATTRDEIIPTLVALLTAALNFVQIRLMRVLGVPSHAANKMGSWKG